MYGVFELSIEILEMRPFIEAKVLNKRKD